MWSVWAKTEKKLCPLYCITQSYMVLYHHNSAQCFSFVSMAAHICSLGQCFIITSLLMTLSLMTKYLTLMCFSLFEIDPIQLIFNKITLLFFWYIVLGTSSYPFFCMKYLVHCDMKLYAPIIIFTVKLFPFNICFLENDVIILFKNIN